MRVRDFLERLVWTAVAAGTGNLTAAALFDVSAWKMAGATGIVAAVQCVTVLARWRLSVLPNPGQMFEGGN